MFQKIKRKYYGTVSHISMKNLLMGHSRHKDCICFGPADILENGMCSYCRKIPQIDSFRLWLQRKVKQKDATDEQLMSTNLKYQPHDILIDRVVKLNAEVKACKSRIFLLGSELART